MSVIWLFHQKTPISAAYFYAREVATPTLAEGDASVHIPYYLRRRTGSKILVDLTGFGYSLIAKRVKMTPECIWLFFMFDGIAV